MKQRFLLYCLFPFFLFIFICCACDGDTTPTTPGTSNVVEIVDDIDVNTTWTSNFIYVIKKWDFYINATLNILAGTVVKFTTEGPYAVLGSGGTINAGGTSTSPVVFTSYKDDAHGGDTNGDGNSTLPARRDWGVINTNGENGSVFHYCEFYYGGGAATSATLDLASGSQATVTHCTFAHNDGSHNVGWPSVLDASLATAGTVIQNNVFYDNFWPITISCEFTMDNSNIFHNPANASQTNTYNCIFVYTTEHVTSHIAWQETEVAYVIDDGDFWIISGASLTLGNDVVLKFANGSNMLLADGTANLVNYNGSGVWFTSIHDDAHKGDTNGNGSGSAPAFGNWIGIYNDPGSYFYTWGNILYDSQ
jgi:hypothetical protein